MGLVRIVKVDGPVEGHTIPRQTIGDWVLNAAGIKICRVR